MGSFLGRPGRFRLFKRLRFVGVGQSLAPAFFLFCHGNGQKHDFGQASRCEVVLQRPVV